MSQTDVLDWVGPQEVRSGIYMIDTGILKVFECPKLSQSGVMDWGGPQEVRSGLNIIGTEI